MSIPFGGDTNMPHNQDLTALHSTILSAIHRHGPQSVMSLWHHAKKIQPLAGVFVAVGELSDSGFIEKSSAPSQRLFVPCSMQWQLTEKGLQHVAANAPCNGAAACNATQQEVEPCL